MVFGDMVPWINIKFVDKSNKRVYGHKGVSSVVALGTTNEVLHGNMEPCEYVGKYFVCHAVDAEPELKVCVLHIDSVESDGNICDELMRSQFQIDVG